MSNTIPPSAPQNTQAQAAQPPVTPSSSLRGIPVESLPTALIPTDQKIQVEGKVTSTTANTITLSTAKGDITVQTTAPLPLDIEVKIDLYTLKAQVLATLVVDKKTAEAHQALVNTVAPTAAAPLPPLKAGDVVIATLLNNSAQPAQSASIPLTLPLIADVLKGVNLTTLISAPALPEAFRHFLSSIPKNGDILSALQNLSTASQKNIISSLQKPEVLSFLKPLITPENFSSLQNTTPLTSNASDIIVASDSPDVSLINVLSRNISKPLSAAQGGDNTVLKSIAPLIEAMNSGTKLTVSPAGLAGLEKWIESLPQNMSQLKITSISTTNNISGLTLKSEVATVTSISPGGFPVITTPEGDMILKTKASIPVGSVITFDAKPLTPDEVLSLQLSNVTTPKHTAAPITEDISTSWPNLQEALQNIPLMREILPTPTQKMTPAALFFLAALRTGLVENWLGEKNIQALRDTGKKDLLEKLGKDFTKLSSATKSESTGEWKSISMPMLHDDTLSQIQFFVRQQHNTNDEGEKSGEFKKPLTRFILNLNLSRMGDMQLDGLMQQKRLDMILRLKHTLPETVKMDLMQAFTKGITETGMEGTLGFQFKENKFVVINKPDQKEHMA